MDSQSTGHVFISYDRENQTYTQKLADSLRQRGFDVWMDARLESGDRWLRTIEQTVRDSAAVVVVMTPESRDSEWVEREILLAQSESKPIFPLLLRGGVFFLLINTRWDDVTNGRLPPDDFYDRLEREVRPPSKEEIIEAPEPTVRKERTLTWPLPGLLALVIGVVVVGVVVSGLIGGGEERTPIPTTSVTLVSEGPTPTPVPPAPTSQPPTPAPGFGVGSTKVREKDGMEMVYVPGGTFQMGSTNAEIDAVFDQCEQDRGSGECQRDWFERESPRHSVTLDSFWMDRIEVTNSQYARCVADGTCSPPSESGSYTRDSYHGDSQFDNYPVIYVDWEDADTYCQWGGGRLPTEAEWEYAARGRDSYLYPWGNDPPNNTLANYAGNVGDTTEVGSYPKGSSWVGALDMAGNVFEWVSDWYAEYGASSVENPTGPDTGDLRVLRGVSWEIGPDFMRSAGRGRGGPDYLDFSIGFRCVVASTSSP